MSRVLVRWALALASYRSVRDETSQRLVEELGLQRPIPILPDLAYSIEHRGTGVRRSEARPLIGINAFPHHPGYWPLGDDSIYQRYVRVLAEFSSWLLQNKYRLCFFPTQLRADPPVARDIRAILSGIRGDWPVEQMAERPIADVPDLVALLEEADIVVATRFHAIALALAVPTPVLAISNHHKMSDLMMDAGQASYLLPIETVTAEALIERFTLLEFNAESVRKELRRRVAAYRMALAHQYDTVLATSRGVCGGLR